MTERRVSFRTISEKQIKGALCLFQTKETETDLLAISERRAVKIGEGWVQTTAWRVVSIIPR